MRKHLLPSLSSLTLGLCLAGGCATGPAKPTGPVSLDDVRYKLIISGGSMDGRVVEFKKRGDALFGCLASPGLRLAKATGVEPGTRLFALKEKAPNEYAGQYRAISGDGSVIDQEVIVFFNDDGMSWNLESATWERQSGSEKLDEAQQARCLNQQN